MSFVAPLVRLLAPRRRAGRRSRPFTAVAAALVLVLTGTTVVGSLVTAPAAYAATGALEVVKSVDATTALEAGDEFTYTVEVACQDFDCIEVTLTDPLPDEFVGFGIVGTPQVTTTSVETSVSLTDCSSTVTADCELAVVAADPLDAGGTGLRAGDGFTVVYTLKAPQNLAPDWAFNGATITNTATARATNAADASADASVSIVIPVDVEVHVAKAWQPASQQFQPGIDSTLTLEVSNTSNSPAESLVLQDPKAAPAADAELPASNPFRIVDLTGFGTVEAPQGADRVQVDAYVENAGVWGWVTGTPVAVADIALPGTVAAADVAGLRFSFTSTLGAGIAAEGAPGAVELVVEQRSADRESGDSLVLGASASNVVSGTVTVPGETPVTVVASAPYTIGGLTIAVSADKSIDPANVPAGGEATGQVSGTNDSNGPLSSLTIADLGFFTADVGFGGFTQAPTWPSGATGAEIVWYLDGSPQAAVPFIVAEIPTPPAGPVTGFELTFTGAIAVGATGGAAFTIDTTPAVVSDPVDSPVALTNSVTVSGTNPAGTDDSTTTAPLGVYFPHIELTLDKSVTPTAPVAIGGTVVVELPTATSADSRYVRPNSIEVTDAATGQADDFWNAFNPTAIAPTQVPAGSVLTVSYTTDGTTWSLLTSKDATAGAALLEYPIDPTLSASIEGLRFTFTAAEFGQGTSVSPNIVFQARPTLRDGGAPTATSTEASSYENVAIAGAAGLADATPVTSNEPEARASAAIIAAPSGGDLYAGKQWRGLNGASKATITAQSGDSAITRLSWGVPTPGYSTVVIRDAAGDEANPENTTFQAFNLTRIRPLSYDSNPLLRWDQVSAIELFHGGAWNTVAAPAGGWMDDEGFIGHALSASEIAGTTALRITLIPDDAARDASADPTRPASGTGIALGEAGANRHFDLQWTLRNTLRVPNGSQHWATGESEFNSTTAGNVINTMQVTGTRSDGTSTGTASDDIRLTDFSPNVDIVLDVSETTLVIPNPGDIDTADYPTVDLTLTAESTALPRASYLRVSTPVCGTAMPNCLSAADGWADNPFTEADYDDANPFEQVTLTGLSFTVPVAQVSKSTSIVTLWLRQPDGSLSTEQHSISAAEALAASQLQNVVGVSVVYQGESPETDGGSIVNGSDLVMTMHTQLRQTLRSGGPGDFVSPATVEGAGIAQSYDPVLASTAVPNATDPGSFALVTAVLDATAGKQFTPSVVLERDRDSDVQVRLTATDGTSTAPTHRVTLTDVDPAFWDAATLTGLGTVTLPAGADQVRVDVQTGTSDWVLGAADATAALPAVDPGDVTGIRFTFDRADGALLSTTTLPADWQASVLLNVTLRDTLRAGGEVSFPDSIPNTLQVESARTDVPQVYAPATADAADTLTLDTGTFALDVSKSPDGNVHTIYPGSDVEWTLQFRNTGTGYLTIADLVDTLPGHLSFIGTEPVYATTGAGTLSTAVELDTSTPGELRFAWPAGGQRMSPGEAFTISYTTALEPGAPTPTTNSFVVTVDQELGTCTNASGNGQGVLAGLSAAECGTSNFVEPVPGASIVSYKGVKGEVDGTLVDGAVNVSNPARECEPDSAGYYSYPCAANTVVGATDEWSLRTVNSGTEAVTSLVLVEPLPVAGDRQLATGSSRGSTWRPVLDDTFGIDVSQLPGGTGVNWEVSTDSDLCVGTGAPTWSADSICASNTWANEATFTGDWATVTGLRVSLDFTGTAAAGLQPGESATVLFRTINEPATPADPSLAPVTVPAVDQFAWNQFGATASFVNNETMRRAPVKAGVTLPTGELEVVKQLTGGATAFAADEFFVDVACTIAGVPMNLGSLARLTLDDAGALTAGIAGIPLGAQCTVGEVGDLGEYGETSRIGDGAVTSVMSSAVQSVAITNDYGWGQLTVSKIEDRAFAAIGEEVTYTVTVANEGERTAIDRTVTDSLPTGASLISTAPAATQFGDVLSWEVDELAPGESVSYTVVVSYAESGRYINRATVDNPPGPWQPILTEKPCAGDPESACTNVTVAALTVTGIVWLDWALLFAGLLSVFGLVIFWVTRRSLSTR